MRLCVSTVVSDPTTQREAPSSGSRDQVEIAAKLSVWLMRFDFRSSIKATFPNAHMSG